MSIPSHGNTLPLNLTTPQASWRDYPAGHNAITTTTAARSLSDRLSRLSEILFSDEIDLRVIDVRSDNGTGLYYVARNEKGERASERPPH